MKHNSHKLKKNTEKIVDIGECSLLTITEW